MSWIRENQKSRFHDFCVRILKCGPIPRHIAIIMDGNRRFAQKNNYDRAKGHLLGFDKLAETLEWCLDLGITEVTVYAFSIENFKRSKEEVDGLLELAREKFTRLMAEKEMIERHGVSFRVLGNWSLLPLDIQQMIADGVAMTKHNNRAILNVCFSYTSQDEMCFAMKSIAEGVTLGLIQESDITESLFEKCLYTKKSAPPDLLIRTSGEVRLSDFLLWQSSYSVLSFVKVLWPEFSRWHLYAAVIHYQRNYDVVQKAKLENDCKMEHLQLESDIQLIEQEMEKTNSKSPEDNSPTVSQRLHELCAERQSRIGKFLLYLEQKDNDLIEQLLQSKP